MKVLSERYLDLDIHFVISSRGFNVAKMRANDVVEFFS